MNDQLERLKVALAERYVIERPLGAGGMATVYLAHDLKHDRRVAVKVLHSELSATMGFERFQREIKIAARLNHPHILALHDSGEADGFVYFVMPYEEGQSLRQRLETEGRLPVPEAVRVLKDVVDALAHAHGQGVVHRDIKPDNVMMSGPHALVTDFGVAKAVREAATSGHLTTAGLALGTPAYMSPEQAAGNPDIDHRADIYAVGVLAYELLAGRPPFIGAASQLIMAQHVTETPEPVTHHRPEVPDSLAYVVMKCLAKEPEGRWQTTEELLVEFERLAATPSDGLPGDTRATQATKRVSPRVAVVVLAVLILAVLGWMLFRPAGTPLVEDRIMVAVFENRTGDSTLDAVGKVAADFLARGLQQTRLVEIVDPRAALSAGDAEGETDGVAAARALAEQLGAATVVTGEYFLFGDSVQLLPQLLETESGKILAPLDPVPASVQNPMAGIEQLNQRVLAAVASIFSDELAPFRENMRLPASYTAYRAYITGRDLFVQGDYQGAIVQFSRSLAEDPEFVGAAIYLATVMREVGRWDIVDSIVTRLNDARDRLTQVESHVLDWLQASRAGDNVGAYRAMRAAHELAPTGPELAYAAAELASNVNRPGEALAILETVDPTNPFFVSPTMVWVEVVLANHLLGRHKEELEAARRARRQFPDDLNALEFEADALAALGRVEELGAVIDEALTFSVGQNLKTPADVMRTAAWELRAHGYAEAAEPLLDRAIQWYEARPGQWPESYASLLGKAGRWEAARDIWREYAERFPESWGNVGWVGVLDARLGDRDEATKIDRQLAALDVPNVGSGPVVWRARIAAVLGQRERAVDLLRDGFSLGETYTIDWHRDPDFESLWDYAPFQELLRPKGSRRG